MKLIVFTALATDIQSGAVWLPSQYVHDGRLVAITNQSQDKKIYCEAIPIGEAFRHRYNEIASVPIDNSDTCIVLSHWYRARLGCKQNSEVELDIRPSNGLWGSFQASIGHPQIVVRLATRLAVWSVFLGLLGVALGVLGIVK